MSVAYALLSADHPVKDVVRLLVVGEAGVVALMALHSLWILSCQPRGPDFFRSVRLGRMARVLGELCALFLGSDEVVKRLGEPVFDWRTPVFQVMLLMWIATWVLVDRTRFKPGLPAHAVDSPVGAAVQELHESRRMREEE